MKWMIASDLHGSAYYTQALLRRMEDEKPAKLVLLGDTLYNKTPGTFPRQALHSASLSFVHPITGEPLNFHAPLPEDMQNLLT